MEGFFGEGYEVMSLEGLCVVGTPDLPTQPPQSFLTPEKGQCDRTFAMQIMSRRKEKRSRKSMVLYQSADC